MQILDLLYYNPSRQHRQHSGLWLLCVCVTLQDSAEQETCKIARLNESDKLEVCIVHTLVFSVKEQQLRVTVVASDCILQRLLAVLHTYLTT